MTKGETTPKELEEKNEHDYDGETLEWTNSAEFFRLMSRISGQVRRWLIGPQNQLSINYMHTVRGVYFVAHPSGSNRLMRQLRVVVRSLYTRKCILMY